ncbi:MAG: hypothetical protein QE279_10095 [Rhodoferax sp.]|nr:hypothetical protein [Rhodoferax sp.]
MGEAQVLFSGLPAKSTCVQEKLITAAIAGDQIAAAGNKEVAMKKLKQGSYFQLEH